jgi:putative FmdB family regulatory protein
MRRFLNMRGFQFAHARLEVDACTRYGRGTSTSTTLASQECITRTQYKVSSCMPIYEYRCASCGAELEKLQKISDPPLLECPECGKDALVKLVSASSFRLKGSGWYETDFKTGKKKNGAAEASGEGAGGDSASSASAPESANGAAAGSVKSSEASSGKDAGQDKKQDNKSTEAKSKDNKKAETLGTDSAKAATKSKPETKA